MNSLIDPDAAADAQSSSGAAPAFPPSFSATLRASPEDFRVDELFDARAGADGSPELDGAGEHLWLLVRKRLANTADVAEALARELGVRTRDVGYAGMKDRRAVTVQWFSALTTGARPVSDAPAPAPPAGGALGDGDWSVLSSARHSRKLRRGAHAGNRFRIVLRDVKWRDGAGNIAGGTGGDGREAGRRALDARVDALRRGGFPNAFGPQRFGRDGRNLDKARAMFADAARGRRGRRTSATARGLLLSAARSAAFNAVLDARVARGDWTRLLDGEPAMLAGSNAFFVPVPGDASLERRLGSGDVSPSGPLPGRVRHAGEGAGTSPDPATGPGPGPARGAVRGACAALEAAVLTGSPALAGLAAGLEAAGVDASRRALVARVPDLAVALEEGDPDALVLTFTLAPGVYATSLLAALGDTLDAPAMRHLPS